MDRIQRALAEIWRTLEQLLETKWDAYLQGALLPQISYCNLCKLPNNSRHSTVAAGVHVPFVLPFSARSGGHLASHIVVLFGHIALKLLSDTCGFVKANTLCPVDPDSKKKR